MAKGTKTGTSKKKSAPEAPTAPTVEGAAAPFVTAEDAAALMRQLQVMGTDLQKFNELRSLYHQIGRTKALRPATVLRLQRTFLEAMLEDL